VMIVPGRFMLKGLNIIAALHSLGSQSPNPSRTACRIPSLINLVPAVIGRESTVVHHFSQG